MKQFLLAKVGKAGVEPIYPMPKDISWQKGKSKKNMFLPSVRDFNETDIKTDIPKGLLHLWYSMEDALEQSSGFLYGSDMEQYLLGKPPQNFINQKDIFDYEERTGIRKSKLTRSVKESGLYSVEYFRFKKNFGFIADINGIQSLPEKGIIRLGGDHRSARYFETSWNDIPVEPIRKIVNENKRFKLILLTPSIFKNGWLPCGINPQTMSGQIRGVDVKLVGACLGRPIGIGGFDLAQKMPKIMKRAVPSGSVYFFEIRKNNVDKIFENAWLNSISDERVQEGFGISLIGGY